MKTALIQGEIRNTKYTQSDSQKKSDKRSSQRTGNPKVYTIWLGKSEPPLEKMKQIAIKANNGKLKGNTTFYCKMLQVIRQYNTAYRTEKGEVKGARYIIVIQPVV